MKSFLIFLLFPVGILTWVAAKSTKVPSNVIALPSDLITYCRYVITARSNAITSLVGDDFRNSVAQIRPLDWTDFGICITDPLPTMDEWKTWPLEVLEKQMSPSRWNPTKTPDQVISEYIQVGSSGTAYARKTLSTKLNIHYGPLPTEVFDVYGTDLPADGPIFFWIHGGYWQEGSKDISGFFANTLYKWGFKTIVLSYTLAPDATIDQMKDEVIAALKKVTETYANATLVVGGHSAGAQLATSLITGNSSLAQIPKLQQQLKGLFLVSGVFDLRPLVPTYVNKPLNLTPISALDLSALFKDVSPPWLNYRLHNLIIVGFHDSPEFQRQSTGYYEQLKSLFDTGFWVSQGDDHFTIIQNLANESSYVSKQFRDYLNKFHDIKRKLSSSFSSSSSLIKPEAALVTGGFLSLMSVLFM